MKSFLIIVLFPLCVSSMDRPARLEQPKPAAAVKSNFVELTTDFFSSPQVPEFFNKAPQITEQELMQLVELAKKGFVYFWNAHGINFLLKVTLAKEQKAKGDDTAKGSKAKLSDQARESLYKAYSAQLKELLGLDKKESKVTPLVSKIDENSVKKLWKELLELANVPIGLQIVKDIRQSYQDAEKNEPAILNFMIDELVSKICGNVLEITNYLKDKRELDDLVQSLKKDFAKEIKDLKAMGSDVKSMQESQRMLIGILSANRLSCPIFIKEKVLEMTKPEKGLISTVKGFFAS